MRMVFRDSVADLLGWLPMEDSRQLVESSLQRTDWISEPFRPKGLHRRRPLKVNIDMGAGISAGAARPESHSRKRFPQWPSRCNSHFAGPNEEGPFVFHVSQFVGIWVNDLLSAARSTSAPLM